MSGSASITDTRGPHFRQLANACESIAAINAAMDSCSASDLAQFGALRTAMDYALLRLDRAVSACRRVDAR